MCYLVAVPKQILYESMKRGARRRSSVWECFEQVGTSNVVSCKKCYARLKYCGASTSTMMAHMLKHVSKTPMEVEDEEEDEKPLVSTIPCTAKGHTSNSEVTQAAHMSPNTETTTPPPERDHGEKKRSRRSSVWDVFIKVDDEVHCTMCDTKLKYKSSTTSMMYHLRSKHSEKDTSNEVTPPVTHAEVTELICRMIEKDMMPISMVDGEGFRELLTQIVNGYKMPSASVVTRFIEGHFHEKAEELRVQLGKVEKVAITADFWAALPFQRYVTVSCSFITEDWKGRSAVLQTHMLSEDDITTESITEKLLSTVQAWGISGKVTACIHNNKEIILSGKASAHVTWDFAACFAMTLHLAVTDGLSEDLIRIIAAAGRLVQHFIHNTMAREALGQKQVQMCLPQHKLINSHQARWDTICDMFERLLEQRWAIKAVLSDRTIISKQEAQALEMEDDSWQIIENFTPVLATLKWATTVVSAETEASISNIYPITFSLIQAHLVPKENDVEQVRDFKLKVQESLRNHMEIDSNELASKPALVASILDPRHKHLSFLPPAGRLAAKVQLHELVSKLDTMTASGVLKDEEQETPVTPDMSQQVLASNRRSDTKNTMMLLLGDNYSSSYATDSEAQVDYYLRDIAPSLDINPLDWWKINKQRFPKLESLARHYLCLPGVSLPSLLSEAGQTFAAMRTRLNPEHMDMTIFVNRNA